jgi:hypothetical protein
VSEKGKELYDEIKQKLEKLEDKESEYWKFTDLWRLGCQAKYKSYDLRFLYEDTSREFVDRHRDNITKMKDDFLENIDEYV